MIKINWYYTNFEYYGLIIKNSYTPDFTRWILSDKYIAKQYAQLNGFNIPLTYQLVAYPKQIKFNQSNCVIKPVDLCDSTGVYLIKNNKNLLTNKKVVLQDIIQELTNLRSSIQNEFYIANIYQGLVPFTGYIVEELLLDEEGNIPYDYKCYVFGGKVFYIAVTYNRKIKEGKQVFNSVWFNRDWEPLKTKMIKKGINIGIYPNRKILKPH